MSMCHFCMTSLWETWCALKLSSPICKLVWNFHFSHMGALKKHLPNVRNLGLGIVELCFVVSLHDYLWPHWANIACNLSESFLDIPTKHDRHAYFSYHRIYGEYPQIQHFVMHFVRFLIYVFKGNHTRIKGQKVYRMWKHFHLQGSRPWSS